MPNPNIFALQDKRWNNAGTVFNGIALDVNNGAGGTGVAAAGSYILKLTNNGRQLLFVDGQNGSMAGTDGNWQINNFGAAGFNDLNVSGNNRITFNGGDTILVRDAANILAQRNGTNAQEFRLYNTFTDASNYEHLSFNWQFSQFYIQAQAAGTGSKRDIIIAADSTSTTPLIFRTKSINRFHIDGNGMILFDTDNALDIGASGANRPRNYYVGTSVIFAQASPTLGSLLKFDNSSGAPGVRVRLGDDSGDANLVCNVNVALAQIQLGQKVIFQAQNTDDLELKDAGSSTTFGSLFFGPQSNSPALARDANFVLAQRNGTNAQIVRIYNTFTDVNNYERFAIDWVASANVATIATQNAGTGSARDITLKPAGNCNVNAGGGFLIIFNNVSFGTDDALQIGANGSSRPNNLWVSRLISTAARVVASLTAAGTAGAGARMFVSDSTTLAFNTTVAGGGTNNVPVFSDGTQWKVG